MVKRVRKYGEGRMTLCAETCNRCFGRAVYEDLHTGGLAVIVSLVSGDFLVDLDTFLNAHRFFEDMEMFSTNPDMVAVVRCMNCVHDGLVTCPMCYIEKHELIFVNHDPEFFCAYGERKEVLG